jgi:hypothetical protein
MGAVQGFAYAAWQMDVGGRNEDLIGLFLDSHDAMQGMLSFLGGLLVMRQVDDIGFMLLQIRTAQGKIAGRILIPHTQTGRAHLLMRPDRAWSPCPPTLMVHRLAVRANRRFG